MASTRFLKPFHDEPNAIVRQAKPFWPDRPADRYYQALSLMGEFLTSQV
jgi:hypothetical protein